MYKWMGYLSNFTVAGYLSGTAFGVFSAEWWLSILCISAGGLSIQHGKDTYK